MTANILHISDKLAVGESTIHGVTRLFSWWFPRFDKNRYNVTLCSLRRKDAAVDYLRDMGLDVICLGRNKFDPLTLLDLIELISLKKINLLHLHGYGATSFGRIAGILTATPCIVHEHMFDANIPCYQKWMDFVLRWGDYQAIAVSESVKEFLVHFRSIPKKKVRVIYNGVPLEIFKEQGSDSPENNKNFTVHPSQRIVITVGRLDPIKGHHYLLEAAKLVLQQHEKVTFLVVGDGDLMDSLQEKSKELEIADHVIFLGYHDDVPALLREADIKVISSLSEGVPMTLFEAMAAGCAVVSTNVGGLREVIEDEKTGFLVPPREPEALAEKISLLLGDETLLERMGTKAKELANRYNILNTVHCIEECYEELLTKENPLLHHR